MKAFVISNSCWNITNFRSELISQLINNKVSVKIISSSDETTEQLKSWGCHFSEVKFAGRQRNFIYELVNIVKIFCLLKKDKPDFVLCFTIKPNLYVGLISYFLSVRQIANITGLGSTILEDNYLRRFVLLLYNYYCYPFIYSCICPFLFIYQFQKKGYWDILV